jgi:hypothetical protein
VEAAAAGAEAGRTEEAGAGEAPSPPSKALRASMASTGGQTAEEDAAAHLILAAAGGEAALVIGGLAEERVARSRSTGNLDETMITVGPPGGRTIASLPQTDQSRERIGMRSIIGGLTTTTKRGVPGEGTKRG